MLVGLFVALALGLDDGIGDLAIVGDRVAVESIPDCCLGCGVSRRGEINHNATKISNAPRNNPTKSMIPRYSFRSQLKLLSRRLFRRVRRAGDLIMTTYTNTRTATAATIQLITGDQGSVTSNRSRSIAKAERINATIVAIASQRLRLPATWVASLENSKHRQSKWCLAGSFGVYWCQDSATLRVSVSPQA